MTTLPTTSEQTIHERLLDVLYGQWQQLGVPFEPVRPAAVYEVVDPEALIWCSLEFLPTEARLREGVTAWLEAHGEQVVRGRLNRSAEPTDPRTRILQALVAARIVRGFATRSGKEQRDDTEISDVCYGLALQDELAAFCADIHDRGRSGQEGHAVGLPLKKPSTALIRARDLLGNDVRHILLVYLLARPYGAKLRDIERYSRYSYRMLAETAARWVSADVLTVDHGYCSLIDSAPWLSLLGNQLWKAVLVPWFDIFDALVRLLRALAKARKKGHLSG